MSEVRAELLEACAAVPSPCFVLDEVALRCNCLRLAEVRAQTGCRVLLALKAFAVWRVFPLLRDFLDGTCASGPWEARLGKEEFGKSVHVCAPGYSETDIVELLETADHISFNSCSQVARFAPRVCAATRQIACGLRVNPQHSESPVEKYSPCGRFSRLGTTRAELREEILDHISGLHLHTLCEQNSDAFARTLHAFETHFGDLLPRMRWVNFGGGHHITRADYDVASLCHLLKDFRTRYGIEEIYLEPGEAVALNAGVLVASVLDVLRNEMDIAILDVSANAHMPDVLEMPYRPHIVGAEQPYALPYTYRLGGLTCLAGDVIGDYSFSQPLHVGQRVIFTDMAHYSIVKTTMFNGVKHPAIAVLREDGRVEMLRSFTYEDYKARMA